MAVCVYIHLSWLGMLFEQSMHQNITGVIFFARTSPERGRFPQPALPRRLCWRSKPGKSFPHSMEFPPVVRVRYSFLLRVLRSSDASASASSLAWRRPTTSLILQRDNYGSYDAASGVSNLKLHTPDHSAVNLRAALLLQKLVLNVVEVCMPLSMGYCRRQASWLTLWESTLVLFLSACPSVHVSPSVSGFRGFPKTSSSVP